MVDLKEFEQKAADLRVLGMKISIGQDTVYEKYWDEDCRRNIYSAVKVLLPVLWDLQFRKV